MRSTCRQGDAGQTSGVDGDEGRQRVAATTPGVRVGARGHVAHVCTQPKSAPLASGASPAQPATSKAPAGMPAMLQREHHACRRQPRRRRPHSTRACFCCEAIWRSSCSLHTISCCRLCLLCANAAVSTSSEADALQGREGHGGDRELGKSMHKEVSAVVSMQANGSGQPGQARVSPRSHRRAMPCPHRGSVGGAEVSALLPCRASESYGAPQETQFVARSTRNPICRKKLANAFRLDNASRPWLPCAYFAASTVIRHAPPASKMHASHLAAVARASPPLRPPAARS